MLLSRGNGRFRAPQEYAAGADPYSIAIGDLNGDGKQDLATANLDANTVSVLLNKRDRHLSARAPVSVNEQPSRVYVLFNRGHK